MSRVKAPNTDHSYFRAAERCGWSRKKAREMMKEAQRRGKAYANIKNPEISKFIAIKQGNQSRRVKYYMGYVFVFASTSTRCITVYPLPKGLLEENEENVSNNVL